jgi:hypothetical protein
VLLVAADVDAAKIRAGITATLVPAADEPGSGARNAPSPWRGSARTMAP